MVSWKLELVGCQQGQLKGDRRKSSPNQNGLGIELLVACALVGECNHGAEKLFVLGHRALVEKVLYNVDGRHLRVIDIDTSESVAFIFILRIRPKVNRLQKSTMYSTLRVSSGNCPIYK